MPGISSDKKYTIIILIGFSTLKSSFYRCSYTFTCADPEKIVTYKFNRFNTETTFDHMVIGDLSLYKPMSADYKANRNQQSNDEVLILHGTGIETGIWNKTKWTRFNFLFERNISNEKNKTRLMNINLKFGK